MQIQKKKHMNTVATSGKKYRYYRKSVTIAGKRRDIRAKDKKGWEKKVSLLKATLVDGLDEAEVRTLTVEKACVFFLEESRLQVIKGIIREKTYEEREYVIRRFIIPLLGNRKVSALNGNDMETIYKQIIHSHSNDLGRCGRVHKILNKMLYWLVRRKSGIQQNPIPTVLMGDMKREYKNLANHSPEPILKIADAHRMLDYAKGKQEEILVHLQLLHGLRIGEALALRYEDIDFSNNRIHVKNQTNKGQVFPVKTAKSVRSIPLQKVTKKLLQTGPHSKAGGFVCSTSLGGPYRYSNYLSRFFKPMMKELTLTLTTHSLRKFFASWLLVEGRIDVITVSKWMGHSSPTVTMNIYAKTIEESKDKYSYLIGNALRPEDEAA